MDIVSKVTELVSPIIKDMGYTNAYVSYVFEQGNNVLRIVVDKDDVISLDDIVKVNDKVSTLLDEADFISGTYLLDVTSLGAEKPIDISKLEKYVGKYVNIHLSHPYKGENILEGDLTDVNDESVTISFRDKTRLINATIERKYIDKARLAIKF